MPDIGGLFGDNKKKDDEVAGEVAHGIEDEREEKNSDTDEDDEGEDDIVGTPSSSIRGSLVNSMMAKKQTSSDGIPNAGEALLQKLTSPERQRVQAPADDDDLVDDAGINTNTTENDRGG